MEFWDRIITTRHHEIFKDFNFTDLMRFYFRIMLLNQTQGPRNDTPMVLVLCFNVHMKLKSCNSLVVGQSFSRFCVSPNHAFCQLPFSEFEQRHVRCHIQSMQCAAVFGHAQCECVTTPDKSMWQKWVTVFFLYPK